MGYSDGLHILASLDGGPLATREAVALGVPPEACVRGCAIVARDRGIAEPVSATHAFLGHIDDQPALAVALGLDRSTPPAALVLAALARYGDEAAARVPGEWSFACWEADTRALTLMASDTLRDPLFFVTDGKRAAIAPNIRTLRTLDGGGTLDPSGLLLSMGRAPVRSAITDGTILRGVRRVLAGRCVRISSDGVVMGTRPPLPPPRPWQGSFAEAIEALDAVLREIVRAQMTRHPRAAAMLSGGLDSSLLAAFAAAERGPHGSLFAVTSAAPPGSDLLDEVEYSRAVAEQAGIAMISVVPARDANVFRPSPATLRWMQQPICSPRHYLYEALYQAAADRGADAIFDGCYGEATVTGYLFDTSWRQRLGLAAREALHRTRRQKDGATTQDAFHVMLAGDALAFARTELRDARRMPDPVDPPRRRDDPWGYSSMIEKNLRETTDTPLSGMRQMLPFRDRRLLTLFAGMPCRFLVEGGVTRAPGRALLEGMVPEHIRHRERGRPFSPDFIERIHRQAGAARDLLPGYRRTSVGDWIDLAWLDDMLSRIAAGAPVPPDLAFAVQSTACAAAFLADWSSTPADA